MDDEFRQQLVTLLPRLRRFACGLAGSIDEGDDLVQSAVERALARADQFEPGSRLDSWMYRILQTLWIDRLRRRKNAAIGVDPADLAEHPGGDAAREMEGRLHLAEVRRAIARLPEEQRVVLLLVTVEGVAYKEAAEVLNLPLGTVMSRLARARIALGKDLESGSREGPRIVRIKR